MHKTCMPWYPIDRLACDWWYTMSNLGTNHYWNVCRGLNIDLSSHQNHTVPCPSETCSLPCSCIQRRSQSTGPYCLPVDHYLADLFGKCRGRKWWGFINIPRFLAAAMIDCLSRVKNPFHTQLNLPWGEMPWFTGRHVGIGIRKILNALSEIKR
jgi:hypothetical protein